MNSLKKVLLSTVLLMLSTDAYVKNGETLPGFKSEPNGNILACMACSKAMDVADSWLLSKSVEQTLYKVLGDACMIIARFDLHQKLHCKGYLRQIGEFNYPVLVHSFIGKDRLCNEMLGLCSRPTIEELDLHQVVDDILKDKP